MLNPASTVVRCSVAIIAWDVDSGVNRIWEWAQIKSGREFQSRPSSLSPEIHNSDIVVHPRPVWRFQVGSSNRDCRSQHGLVHWIVVGMARDMSEHGVPGSGRSRSGGTRRKPMNEDTSVFRI